MYYLQDRCRHLNLVLDPNIRQRLPLLILQIYFGKYGQRTYYWSSFDRFNEGFRSPFDTVDHGILYDKLKVASFADTAVDWLKSYLSQRTQVTAIGNVHSTVKPIQVGVPQESVLGPLLFIIYANDIPLCIKHCNVLLYADDTVIYFSSFDVSDIEDKLNSDIANLSRWLNENLLTLNKAKGKFVVFGCQQKVAKIHQISLEINGLAVDGEVRSTSYAVLPYVKGLTEPLRRILKPHDIRVTTKPLRTLEQMFPSTKDRPLPA
jgi:hypothetical protein